MVDLVFNRVGGVFGWGFNRNIGSFLWLGWNKLFSFHFVDDGAAIDSIRGKPFPCRLEFLIAIHQFWALETLDSIWLASNW
jgi:hypothetical protein